MKKISAWLPPLLLTVAYILTSHGALGATALLPPAGHLRAMTATAALTAETAEVRQHPTWRVALLCGGCALLGAAVAVGAMKLHSSKAQSESVDDMKDTSEPVTAEEVVEEAVESAGIEYERLLKTSVQKAAQSLGPKLAKGSAVRSLLEQRMSTFQEKAKSFVLGEMNSTAGAVLRAMDAEEAMLLLDWNETVTSNFPSPSILLAGLLSPAFLSIALVQHVAQVLMMLLPVFALSAWAIWEDRNHMACSIPTMWIWVKVQCALVFILVVAHVAQIAKIINGRAWLRTKAQELGDRIRANVSQDKSLSDMREIFVCHSVMHHHMLQVEDSVRTSIFHHIVGMGTISWLLMGVWTGVLVMGWTFVPGVTAFHPNAHMVAKGDFCGAWATVLVARMSFVFAVLFLFVNVATSVFWVASCFTHSQRFEDMILKKASDFDKSLLGLPVAQIFVKAFLLRGASETLDYRYNSKLYEKARLEQDRAELQDKIRDLDLKLARITDETAELKPQIDASGGDFEAAADRLQGAAAQGMADWKAMGAQAISAAEARAAAEALQQQTTKDLEEIMNKITKAAKDFQESEAVQAKLSQARETAAAAQEKAQQMATEGAAQVRQKAKELQDSGAVTAALSQAQDMANQGAAYAKQKSQELQEPGGSLATAMAQAQGAVEQVKEQARKAQGSS
eukprot:TRINITY_DN27153_c0_g1_i1.p1 TRINITY_DN27153_c0_g1~~TRINITY_DN27153_c0_g1_i1.p1  ORF type:complete len:679 (+),score=181.17 TRINITY_DN27153_c0_g1_i1:111-2147(+)